MTLSTPVWTEFHTHVARLIAVSSVGGLAGLTEPWPVPAWVMLALAATVVVSLALDPLGGVTCGVLVGAALVWVRGAVGSWGPEQFLPALVETCALAVAGAVAGGVGRRLRLRGSEESEVPESATWEVYGLLDEQSAMARLAEEVDSEQRHDGRVSLVLVQVSPHSERPVEEGTIELARKCVARLVANRTSPHDVPFAISADRFGVILPHATGHIAWETVAAVLAAARTAPLLESPLSATRVLTDAICLDIGLCERDSRRLTVDEMVAEAEAALVAAQQRRLSRHQHARPESSRP